ASAGLVQASTSWPWQMRLECHRDEKTASGKNAGAEKTQEQMNAPGQVAAEGRIKAGSWLLPASAETEIVHTRIGKFGDAAALRRKARRHPRTSTRHHGGRDDGPPGRGNAMSGERRYSRPVA